MSQAIDLLELSVRESEQTEWKENVADVDDVVATLSAFANDLANLGGGYVVCGAREGKDEHGFPMLVRTGLEARRLKEVESKVLARCRDLVSPPITPRVEEMASDAADRRILVFVQPATGQAHMFRTKHMVRVSRSTIEAKNGVLRNLLVRKGVVEPWDRRPCEAATDKDLDLWALRDVLQRMGVFSPERGVDPYLSGEDQISSFVPSLCVKEPLSGVLRPRNFAVLLFGRQTQRFVPGAFSLFSIYPAVDRSDPHAERHELAGNLLEQARRLTELLDVQSYTAFDKTDSAAPNSVTYPKRALYEALGNALAHRDYELPDPTRITVFSDRIEVLSPGSLPVGVDVEAFREGRSPPKWRNQTLAWFMSRLQLAQAEGQGIPTILRVMRQEGHPPPTLDADAIRVLCVLPAHPRHALLRDLRAAEQALALGDTAKAQDQVRLVLGKDPLNYRALSLFAEVQQALRDPGPVEVLVQTHLEQLDSLPATVLVQLAEALLSVDDPPASTKALAERLALSASRGRLEERQLRRIIVTMLRAQKEDAALSLIEEQVRQRPEWQGSASLLQLRGDALLNLAKRCRSTAQKGGQSKNAKARAWQQFHAYLDRAERDLSEALSRSLDPVLTGLARRNLDYLEEARRQNPPHGRR